MPRSHPEALFIRQQRDASQCSYTIAMDSRSLHTASSYINNLLLSRGLLRNGVPIDWAEPAKAQGGVDATMAKVINLVHDMILRRDVGALQR